MSDVGKKAAIETLRKEVGFGCPVCRSPFLEWHHFDPPWEDEHHWRPEGMIAMCPNCHGPADRRKNKEGAYSKEELRKLKRGDYSRIDVATRFPWWQNKTSVLVRIGGNYSDASSSALSVNGIPIIGLKRDDSGHLLLSLELRDGGGQVVVSIRDNYFHVRPSELQDLIAPPKTTRLKIWVTSHDIGIDFSFKRMTEEQLRKQLQSDQRRSIEAFNADLNSQGLPDEWLAVGQDSSGLGETIISWAKEHCQDDEGLFPVLDFEHLTIYFHGQKTQIKDGIGSRVFFCFSHGNSGSNYNIQCQCAMCSLSVGS